jgi:hypothetical protein
MNALFRRQETGAVIDDYSSGTHAMRALVVLLIAGFAVLRQAAPGASAPAAIPVASVAKPVLQTMVQFDFRPPLWGMPEATTWTHMDFSIVEIDPGTSFDTDAGWYTSTDGPFLIVVLSGALDIAPNGPAIVYPADHTQQPQPIAPGTSASLGPNDAIAFSVIDAATGTNPGTEPLVALFALAGSEDFSVPGAFSMPIVINHPDFQYVDGMPVLPTAGATVSIQRVELQPYDSFVFDPATFSHYLPALDSSHTQGLQMAYGAVDEWSPELETIPVHSSSNLMYPELGPHTLFALGDEPVELYFFVVEPYPASATPAP